MKLQTYLASSNKGELTFCLDSLQEGQNDMTAVVLVSGFSEPLCDMDYYFSKMAKYLYQQGNSVFQMDLFAHGDSTGKSEDITISKLMNSIMDVIEHAMSNGFSSIIIVSRGIMGTLISDYFASNSLVTKIIVVNPWYYSPAKSKELRKAIDNNSISFQLLLNGYCHGLEDLPQQIKDVINVYSELGVFNQAVSKEFIFGLLNFDYSNFEKVDKAVFLETNTDKSDVSIWKPEMGYRDSLDFDYISLVYNAIWHYNTYKTINKSIKGEL